jgi:hypothetical protein
MVHASATTPAEIDAANRLQLIIQGSLELSTPARLISSASRRRA